MIWTHIYDLILKLITLTLFIIIFAEIPYFKGNQSVVIILGIILFFISYNLFIRTFATYLYCKFTLKMNINLNQAKQLNDAFSPIFPLNMSWLPMNELKNIENDNKFDIAINTYNNWKEHNKQIRKQQLQKFNKLEQKTTILTVIMYLLMGYFMIAGFINLPPANYLAMAYCKLFDTDRYYPILNSLALVFLTFFLFKKLDKEI